MGREQIETIVMTVVGATTVAAVIGYLTVVFTIAAKVAA